MIFLGCAKPCKFGKFVSICMKLSGVGRADDFDVSWSSYFFGFLYQLGQVFRIEGKRDQMKDSCATVFWYAFMHKMRAADCRIRIPRSESFDFFDQSIEMSAQRNLMLAVFRGSSSTCMDVRKRLHH
jgi:hypothetical protein